MSLFDSDEFVVAKTESSNGHRARAPKSQAPPQPVLDGLEKPWEPPPQQYPNTNRIEAVAQQVRSMTDASANRGGEFRCDAVTHTFLLMLAQQFEFSICGCDPARMSTQHGRILGTADGDEEYGQTWEWLLGQMRTLHPVVFPPQPLWPVPALRKWESLFAGVDMIGWRGELEVDVPSLVFQHAASMSGKQNAWGSFYTPFHLCKLMAIIAAGDPDDPQPWLRSLHEPCIGSGSMVVAAFDVVRCRLRDLNRDGYITADESVRLMRQWVNGVRGQDIDPEAVWCSAAQLSVRSGFPVVAPHPYRGRDAS